MADEQQALTILIAEDDRASRHLLATCLKRGGYETLEAITGNEAVQLALEHQPDLAILDIMLPGLNGTEVAATLRQETDVPFMFLSALDEAQVVQKAIDEGALGYLVKPLNVPQLIPTVQAALARAQDLARLRTAERNLSTALSIGRETSIAVGILMERHKLSQAAAFELLRVEARSQRRRVADLAEMIVGATETLNTIVGGGRGSR
ncbi:ANTAR domain-containing response regulator [Azoarcus sp. KH32C]|uniref:ANTAR domain-containing response regulator n=1 Tax=Azoarcus sp. KH32C TaxID=748247 RepID=UPI0002386EAD|nr:response regulator [Azoarcus sp. KH32C]BAL24421.1 hypothetical protein AZKH_2108 [Azoarcus sp. KH32C]